MGLMGYYLIAGVMFVIGLLVSGRLKVNSRNIARLALAME
jgi:hypothetical protein